MATKKFQKNPHNHGAKLDAAVALSNAIEQMIAAGIDQFPLPDGQLLTTTAALQVAREAENDATEAAVAQMRETFERIYGNPPNYGTATKDAIQDAIGEVCNIHLRLGWSEAAVSYTAEFVNDALGSLIHEEG